MLEAAIIGTGPYGLSIAAHLSRLGIPHRTFGRPMESWLSHMPKGMMLKSDGFASDIYDPNREFTLKEFCIERGIEYSDVGTPVPLEVFSAYGIAFRDRLVPEVEEVFVAKVDHCDGGFMIKLETGETLTTKRVILAVGITHFGFVPPNLRHLPSEFLSHSSQHSDLELFRDRSVAVIGGGSSGIDLAGLLRESGADVQLVARAKALKFHEKMPMDKPRSLWQQARSPLSGLGPGLRSRLFANSPNVFYHLPKRYRLDTVRTFLGPAGGWFAREKVIGKVPLVLGFSVEHAEIIDNRVCLHLRGVNGSERKLHPNHVIAATGYKVDLNRLTFLSPKLRERIETLDAAPILSSTFESSIPGLYFVGLAAANSFGPVMRFAYGAGYTARHLTKKIAELVLQRRAWNTVQGVQTIKNVDN
jgi:Pyridine nucleotide-disulphide oxidoreductase